jgi:HSP20 family molecular chaperone IbpA
MTTLTPSTTAPATRREERYAPAHTLAPLVDVYETDDMYVLLADMPGVQPDGLDVIAERDSLTIRGRVERPASEPDYREFELADYYRAFTLSEDLESDKVSAILRDGVLRVEIPKSPQVKPKKIQVRTE